MSNWVFNISKQQFEDNILPASFINSIMRYDITATHLPNNRVHVKMSIDVFGLVPTCVAAAKYLGYKITTNKNIPVLGNQLQFVLDGQFVSSYNWFPNLADYCFHDMTHQDSIIEYFKQIVTLIPEKERRLVIHKLKPTPNSYQLDYDISKWVFEEYAAGLFAIISSYDESPELKTKLVDAVVNILRGLDSIAQFGKTHHVDII